MIRKSLIGLAALAGLLAGCQPQDYRTEQQKAVDDAVDRAAERHAYVPQNSLDFLNYDHRQRKSDDPTTIQWCTFFPPTQGQQPITFPIVGKLTSSGKRPFASDPGPDGMYGTSGEYRYGFTPGDNMVEIFGSSTGFCSTEPTVFQRTRTTIVVVQDPSLNAAQAAARAVLKNGGDQAAAYQAMTKSLGGAVTLPQN